MRVKVGCFPAQHASIIKNRCSASALNNAESLLLACQRDGRHVHQPGISQGSPRTAIELLRRGNLSHVYT